MGRTARKDLGLQAREWVMKNFPMDNMVNSFDKVIEDAIANHKKPVLKQVTL
jgi:hypothetical protein